MSIIDSNKETIDKGNYSDASNLENGSDNIGYSWGSTNYLTLLNTTNYIMTGSASFTSGSILDIDEEEIKESGIDYRSKALEKYLTSNFDLLSKKVERKIISPDDVSYSARVLEKNKDFIKVEVFDPSNEQFSEKLFEPTLFYHLDTLEEGDYILLRKIKRPGNISLSILDGEKLVSDRVKSKFEDYSEFSYLDEIDLPSSRKGQ
ncbi:MAG TPA: hypothetical protein DF712_09845 [Balneola sp.]|jgi:hypothetical protein|nr:hypothetical protein [Bacteroidota bacterium]HCI69879.1 hypothetical protein [Balneola sp.]HCT52750.1 hypothetical protein [Balneola sp.]|tara:strand:+ start:518 stop:1132 length:615 start_codon:yes stop_codon:yes gene_type:complete